MIKNKIFYNYKNQMFYKLLGRGMHWENSQVIIFLLQELQSDEKYSVPEYIFQMNFIRMDKHYYKRQLQRDGWSEFSIKRISKDYLQTIQHVSS